MRHLSPVRSFRNRMVRSPRAIRAILEAVEPRQLLTTVSGQVFDDLNRNEQRDASEPGVSGSVVFADYNYNGKLDAGETSVTVPASGQYTLVGDANKAFALRVVAPGGYAVVGPYDGNTPYYLNGNDTPLSGRNFWLASAATSSVSVVTGVVFDDYDHTGTYDSTKEAVLQGKTVYADLNNNGKFDAGEPSSVTAYQSNLMTGYRLVVPRSSSFAVRVIPTVGFTPSYPGGADGFAIDTHTNTAAIIRADLGLYSATDFITGTFFVDKNKNGQLDDGEQTGAGQRIFIDLNRNGLLDANETNVAASDANGNFVLAFDRNAVLGTDNVFSVAVLPAAGYARAFPASLFGGGGYGPTGPIHFYSPWEVTQTAPTTPPTTTLTVTVFRDGNGNQQLDPQETGVAGQLVYADYNYNNVLDPGEPSVTTTSATTVALTVDQRPFALRLLAAAGYTQSLPASGPNYIEFRNGSIIGGTTFALRSNTVLIISHVFNDVNADGQEQPNETGVPSGFTATAYLDLNDNGKLDPSEPSAVVDPTTGAYTITATSPNGLVYLRFVFDAADYRPTGALDYPHPYALFIVRNTDTLLSDAGVTSVGGAVGVSSFLDSNGDGIQQADEFPTGTAWIDLNGNGVKDAGEPTPYYDLIGGHPPSNNPYLGKLKLAYGTYRVALDANNDGLGDYYQYVTISAAVPIASADFVVPSAPLGQLYFQPAVDGTDQLFPRTAADRAYYQFFGSDYSFWADLNRDGIREANEPLATQVTTSQGFPRLSFTLPYGVYAIAVGTSSAVGTAAIASHDLRLDASTDGPVNNAFYSYNVPALTGIALGYVFKDTDKDGVYNFNVDQLLTGKPGSPGWAQVWADYNDNGKIDAGEPLAQLGSDGADSSLDGMYVLKTGQTFTLGSTAYAGLKGDTSTPLASTSAKQRVTLSPSNSPLRIDRGFGDAPVTPPPVHAPFPTVYVYRDTNQNGTIDPSEAVAANGAAGQTVFADYNYNGVLDSGEDSAVTDASGTATLNAQNKPFQLVLKPAAGFTQSAPGAHGVYYYELRSGAPFGYGNTFGVTGGSSTPLTTTITGHVFFDANSNDYYDAGETLNSSYVATVFIDANNNRVFDSGERVATIAADGTYTFSNVPVGTSGVIRAVANGNSPNGPAVPLTPMYLSFIANTPTTAGTSPTTGPDLGFTSQHAQISEYVLVDVNGNGTVDNTDRAVAPADVWLDLNANGKHDAGEPSVPQNAYGSPDISWFSTHSGTINLPLGAYTLAVRYAGDTDDLADATQQIGPTGSYNVPTWFLLPAATSVVTGTVFSDNNTDGVRQSNESGTPQQLVYADFNGNSIRDAGEPATYSDTDGSYALEVGNRAGTIRLDLSGSTNGAVSRPAGRPFDFTAGKGRLDGLDLGIGAPGPGSTSTINGRVFNDLDGSGTDNNDAGLAGRTVFADVNYNGVLDAGEAFAITDSFGNYSLTAPIAPFALRVKLATGDVQTAPAGNVYYYEVRNGTLLGYGAGFGIKHT